MAVETIKSRTASVKVENGTDSQGNLRLASVSMGQLSKDRWDGDKILAIATALEPCINNVFSSIEGGTTFTLSAS